MEARNLEREARLRGYTGRRVYHVINYRTGRQASLEVRMTFRAPNQKEFEELSASGSKFLRNRVFKPIMETEREAMQPQQKRLSAITHENYDFALAGEEVVDGRRLYMLTLTVKRKDKYLLEGKVWVDREDFAVARIEGRLVKRPSFWTRKVDIVRRYRKIDQFWLPAGDDTVTDILLFGRSAFTIQYIHYQVSPAASEAVNSSPGGWRE